jgi:hypothetical protein
MTAKATFNDDDLLTLAALANAIIPPSAAHAVPGAGDPTICQNIAASARQPERLLQALAELNALAEAAHDALFATLPDSASAEITEQFRQEHASSAGFVEALTMQAYYRDDRVMASLGMEVRSPFPEGYKPPEGDWSLLDPVRRRAPLFRKAD